MAGLTLKTVFEAVDKISGPIKTMKANTFKFSTETTAAFKKVGDGMKKLGAMALVGAAATSKALYDFVQRGDDIDRNAKILGVTAQAFQELAYAANFADVSQEDMASAMKKMSVNVGELRVKSGALYSTLTKVNPQLAVQLRSAKDNEEAFGLLADAIAQETNANRKAQIAVAAFGKAGQALLPMMDDLAERRKEARDSGSIISDKDVANAAALDETLKKLKASGMSVANQVLGSLAEKLTPLLERFAEWAAINKDIIALKIGQAFEVIGGAINFLTQPGVISGIASLALGIKALGIASMVLGVGNPLVAIVGGIVALITLIATNWDKIVGFFDRITGGSQKRGEGMVTPVSSPMRQPIGAAPPSAPAGSATSAFADINVNFNNTPSGTKIDTRSGTSSGAPAFKLATFSTLGGAH
jgi:hypothetical protein